MTIQGADLSVDAMVAFAYDLETLEPLVNALQTKRTSSIAALPATAKAWLDAQSQLAQPNLQDDMRKQLLAVSISEGDRSLIEKITTDLTAEANRPIQVDLRRIKMADLNLSVNHEAVATIATLMPLISDAPKPPASQGDKP